jgi:hypothetical protein
MKGNINWLLSATCNKKAALTYIKLTANIT